MALRSVFVCLFVGLTLCGLSPVYAQGPGNGQGNGGGNAPIEQPVPVPETLTVDVNCADGDTISQALERPAVELTILVSGTCTENVFITRDNVILRGTTLDEGDPTAEIVAASTDLEAPSFGVVVYVAGAQTVRIEDLKIRGGRWGIAVTVLELDLVWASSIVEFWTTSGTDCSCSADVETPQTPTSAATAPRLEACCSEELPVSFGTRVLRSTTA